MNKNLGRPATPGMNMPHKWTDERIEQEADALLEWIKDDKNFFFKDFCRTRDYSSMKLVEFAKRNEKFKHAYLKARDHQEVTIAKQGLFKNFDGGMATFILKSKHGYKDGDDSADSWDESSPSSKALRDIKQICIAHVNQEPNDDPNVIG